MEVLIGDHLEAAARHMDVDPAWSRAVLRRMARQRVVRRRVAASVACLCMAAASVLVTAVGHSIRVDDTPVGGGPHRLVDVGGGRDLYLSCRGTAPAGSPTVLMDADLGAGPRSFGNLPAALTAGLEVCTYDRAGTGRSDAASSFPRTAADLADDIAAVVEAGHLSDQVLLVSSGFSAMTATVFAAEHPDLLAGLILLDPIGPDVASSELSALGGRAPGEPRLVTDLRNSLTSDARSQNGEQVSWPASEQLARELLDRPGPAFGAIPVAVLWSERGREVLPALPAAVRRAWWEAVTAGQRAYAAESSVSDLHEVRGAVAAPATEAPDEVARTIRRLAAADAH